MKSEKIDIPIQAICVKCKVSSLKEGSEASSDINPGGIKITQLLEISGLAIEALIDAPKTGGTKLDAKLGYFGLDLQLQKKDFIRLDFPSGIAVKPDLKKIDLKSRIIFFRESSVSSNLQSLLDSINGGDHTTILGITGIRLGNSEQNAIQTFSKIVVELDSQVLQGQKFPSLAGQLKTYKPLATLTKAGVELKSPNDLSLEIGASLNDAPLSLSIGSLNFVFF